MRERFRALILLIAMTPWALAQQGSTLLPGWLPVGDKMVEILEPEPVTLSKSVPYEWSPSGKYLLLLSAPKSRVPGAEVSPWDADLGVYSMQSREFRLIVTDTVRRNVSLGAFQWVPTKDQLYVEITEPSMAGGDARVVRHAIYTPSTGTMKILHTRPAEQIAFATLSNNGNRVAIREIRGPDAKKRGPNGELLPETSVLLDLVSGKRQVLTAPAGGRFVSW